ncbi:MAG: hypothetical protein K5854_03690 [Prevotella sp.]|nr:hypothetical protein [Prevotella sp.]
MSLKDKILSVIAILPWIYFLLVYPIALQILKWDGVRTKAIITADPGGYYKGTKWYLYYEFWYNGERYRGNSQIPKNPDVVGDSIDIVFLDFLAFL